MLRAGRGSDAGTAKDEQRDLAKKSKIKLQLLTRIEEGQITGEEFGLREICFLANGMNITPYRLMLKYEQLYEER
jgi:transcriptional regulator with XRE-family HTH domain